MATRWQRLVEIVGLSVLALVVYFVMPLESDFAMWWAGLVVAGVVGALLPFAVRRALRVLDSEHPLADAVASLALFVSLLAVSFSTVYFVLGTRYDGQLNGIETKIDALYFTVTTMSTVGYGDIVAVGETARALVTANILTNVVFLAMAVRIVSWAWQQRRQEIEPSRQAPSHRVDDAGRE